MPSVTFQSNRQQRSAIPATVARALGTESSSQTINSNTITNPNVTTTLPNFSNVNSIQYPSSPTSQLRLSAVIVGNGAPPNQVNPNPNKGGWRATSVDTPISDVSSTLNSPRSVSSHITDTTTTADPPGTAAQVIGRGGTLGTTRQFLAIVPSTVHTSNTKATFGAVPVTSIAATPKQSGSHVGAVTTKVNTGTTNVVHNNSSSNNQLFSYTTRSKVHRASSVAEGSTAAGLEFSVRSGSVSTARSSRVGGGGGGNMKLHSNLAAARGGEGVNTPRGGTAAGSNANTVATESLKRSSAIDDSIDVTTTTKKAIQNIEGDAVNVAFAENDKEVKNKHTISLNLIFFIQCLLIAGAFTAIISYSSTQIDKTASQLINDGITSSLMFAATEVATPFTALEETIMEYRARYYAFGLLTGQTYYPCDDQSASTAEAANISLTFQPSAFFYSDTKLAVESIPRLTAVSVISVTKPINWSNVHDYDDMRNSISQCSVNYYSIYRRYNNRSITTVRVPTKKELARLDSIPLNSDESSSSQTDGHEGNHLITALTATRVSSAPMYTDDAGRYMLFVSPLLYSYVNATSGVTTVNFQADVRLSSVINRIDVANYTILSGLAFSYSIEELFDTLLLVTPADPDSHTSLYDLGNNKLLSSTRLPRDEQFDLANKRFYDAGYSSSLRVNNAFFESGVSKQEIGVVSVDYEDNTADAVVSSYVFETSGSDSIYGVVQGTPKKFYFKEVTKLVSVMIALGVICCVLVVAACIAVVLAIQNGIDQLLANMALAAQMKNDRTTFITTVLKEVDKLAKGFGKMNDKLGEARAYLPQHMLLTTSSDESAVDDDDEGTVRVEDGPLARGDGTLATIRSQVQTATSSQYSATTGSEIAGAAPTNRKAPRRNLTGGGGAKIGAHTIKEDIRDDGPQLKIGKTAPATGSNIMTQKRVTILSVNFRNFHKIISTMGATSSIPPIANSMTDLVSNQAHANRGVIDAFHGDHFVVSFNAVRPNPEGPIKAARCCVDLMDEVASAFSGSSTAAGAALASGATAFLASSILSMGISSGRASVGHLGSATLKRLSIVGAVYSKAIALEKLCRKFNTLGSSRKEGVSMTRTSTSGETDSPLLPIQCLVDASMPAEIQHQYLLQLLGGVYGAPFTASRSSLQGAPSAKLPPILTAAAQCLATNSSNVSAEALLGRLTLENAKLDSLVKKSNSNPAERSFECLYALRGPVAGDNEAAPDEWLYEIGKGSSEEALFDQINVAMKVYLDATQSISLSANETSPLLSACAEAIASSAVFPFGEETDGAHLLISNSKGLPATFVESFSTSVAVPLSRAPMSVSLSSKVDALVESRKSRLVQAAKDLESDLRSTRAALFAQDNGDGECTTTGKTHQSPIYYLAEESLWYASLIAAPHSEQSAKSFVCEVVKGFVSETKSASKESPVGHDDDDDDKNESGASKRVSSSAIAAEVIAIAEEEARLFASEPAGAPRGLFFTGSN